LLARLTPTRVTEGDDLATADIGALLRQEPPDLIVSWYFTRLIEPSWLALARLGGIGAHPSLLPKHRGPNPFFWAIDHGDQATGVSIHRLSAAYDTGPVLAQRSIATGDRDAWQLARALDRPSLQLLREVVHKSSRGESLPETPQDEALANWAGEPEGEQLGVDWSWPSERVLRRIRALAPVPGLALELCGVRFFVTRASRAPSYPLALNAGEAALLRDHGALQPIVRTADGALTIERVCIGLNDLDLGLNDGEICSGQQLAQAMLRAQPHMVDSVIEQPR
jgi:methionyl-tRNA formyltransferase